MLEGTDFFFICFIIFFSLLFSTKGISATTPSRGFIESALEGHTNIMKYSSFLTFDDQKSMIIIRYTVSS